MNNTDSVHRDRWIGFMMTGIAFAVYAATLCRTIYTGDDGDFLTAMATFGTSHPTGYPLFLLLGRLCLSLFGFLHEPAQRINLMTALFGAASVGMFYRFLVLLVRERFWAATAALLLAFGATLWQQSLSCEVYSLTGLFLTTLLYLAALWRTRPDDTRLLRILTVTYGLALTNHLTIALFFPAFLVFVFTTRRTLWREGKVLASMVGLFLLPLTLYAYLPISAHFANAPVEWGSPGTLQSFWMHISGEQYRNLMFQNPKRLPINLRNYGGLLRNEYGLWLLWLVPVGFATLWNDRTKRPIGLLLAAIWVADVAYAIGYNIVDIYVYYIPSYIAAASLIAVGASRTMHWTWERFQLPETTRARHAVLIGIVALAFPLVQMSMHYVETDKSGNYLEDDFSANILRSAPPNAIVITGSSVTFSVWYRKFVLRERPDITVINWGMQRAMFFAEGWYYRHLRRQYPDIRNTNPDHIATEYQVQGGEFLNAMLSRAMTRGVPVILIPDATRDGHSGPGGSPSLDAAFHSARFERVPWGIGERIYPHGQRPSPARTLAENERILPTLRYRGVYSGAWIHADPLQEYIALRYADADLGLARLAESNGRFDLARQSYDRALRLYRIPAAEAGRARCLKALAVTPADGNPIAPEVAIRGISYQTEGLNE